jgi:hypothetical protein
VVKEKNMFDYSKSMKRGKYRPVTPNAATTAKLSFPSMAPILAEREKAEQGRIADIIHPDTSKRLRFPSLGDAPRARPVRAEFKSDAHFRAAMNHWNAEQKAEAEIYERALR